LDLCADCYWRGAPLFSAEQVAPLMATDRRGFRYLRPGAEGVLLLLLNGIRRGGAADREAIENQLVRELIESDSEGVRAAATVLRVAQDECLTLVDSLRHGTWKRTSALRLELGAIARAVASPRNLASRAVFRAHAFRGCEIIRATRTGRNRPHNLASWLQQVSETHRVVDR
jgi:hypothetical protein